jgi:hypothetical protein
MLSDGLEAAMRNLDKFVPLVAMLVPLVLVAIGWQVLSAVGGGERPVSQPSQVVAQPAALPTTETAGVTVGTTPRAVPPTAPTAEPTLGGGAGATSRGTPAADNSVTVDASDPSAAVTIFYELVARHEFDAATQLWSPRMQASYPPAENIHQRFRQTSAITLQRADMDSVTDAGATVVVDLIESTASGPRRYVGRWHLVRDTSGWLLDQPELRLAP